MEIRPMEERDAEQLAEIEKEAFTSPWSQQAFLNEVRENKLARYLVVEDQGKILGYAGMWLIINEAHITNIAVREEYRGRGIGNLLVQGLISLAMLMEIEAMTLEVRVSNKIAQDLYKKHGFIESGIRPKYYDNKEDALIMWKRINRGG